jgi:hypothetical protein
MAINLVALVASALGIAIRGEANHLSFPIGSSGPSEVQKRMHAAWVADAPRRNRLAAECVEWNKHVTRRNQRFVRRQIARGRSVA